MFGLIVCVTRGQSRGLAFGYRRDVQGARVGGASVGEHEIFPLESVTHPLLQAPPGSSSRLAGTHL